MYFCEDMNPAHITDSYGLSFILPTAHAWKGGLHVFTDQMQADTYY
jgi:hypothetical protein